MQDFHLVDLITAAVLSWGICQLDTVCCQEAFSLGTVKTTASNPGQGQCSGINFALPQIYMLNPKPKNVIMFGGKVFKR